MTADGMVSPGGNHEDIGTESLEARVVLGLRLHYKKCAGFFAMKGLATEREGKGFAYTRLLVSSFSCVDSCRCNRLLCPSYGSVQRVPR